MDRGTSTTSDSEVLTLDTIKKMAKQLYENEPFAQLMRQEGFDPAKGDVLLLPYELERPAPSYVKFTRSIKGGAYLIRNPKKFTELPELKTHHHLGTPNG